MAAPDTVIFNTLEQLVSGDANLVGGLAGKAVGDLMFATMRDPDNLFTVNRSTNAVRRGLTASIGAGLTIDIAPGEIVQFNSGTAFNADASPIELGRLDASTNVAVGPADGANPRIALISATITQTNTGGSSRNILSLPSRTVTAVVVNKRSNPTLTLTATLGTAIANPVIPATPAGQIPLFAIYIPAAAATIAATDIADMRVYYTEWSNGQANERRDGFWPVVDTTITNVRLRAGSAMIMGAPAVLGTDLVYARANLLPAGSGAFAASTEYQCYALVPGNGSAVGTSVASRVVLVLTTGNAPTSEGRPTSPLTYRPLFESNTGANNWQETTQNALYIGAFITDAAGAFTSNGYGFQNNRAGTSRFKLAANGGIAPVSLGGWLKQPTLQYVNASSVTIGDGVCILDGMPVVFSAITVDMGSDLFTGDTESPDTWYYVYVRRQQVANARGEVTSVVGRISSQAPQALNTKATAEAGFAFNDYVYVGSVLNNAAQDFVEFRKDGGHYTFIPRAPGGTMPNGGIAPANGSTAIGITATAFEMWLPATTRTGLISLRCTRAGAGTSSARIMHRTGNANSSAVTAYFLTPPGAAGEQCHLNCQIVGDNNNQWEGFEALASDLSLIYIQTGYFEDLY